MKLPNQPFYKDIKAEVLSRAPDGAPNNIRVALGDVALDLKRSGRQWSAGPTVHYKMTAELPGGVVDEAVSLLRLLAGQLAGMADLVKAARGSADTSAAASLLLGNIEQVPPMTLSNLKAALANWDSKTKAWKQTTPPRVS